jgi:hypothetical protein
MCTSQNFCDSYYYKINQMFRPIFAIFTSCNIVNVNINPQLNIFLSFPSSTMCKTTDSYFKTVTC